ncbi:error-prone DNA polymerase [Consotaella aegiceratis]|uniref:error-prone DNA polymerase n=1 Tax=Consotaella aegiceratis TaxID=3097961 RepID=UPI002F40935A
MSAASTSSYVELAAASNFSFLRGASHPQDLVAEAIRLGHAGLGLADRNSVAGVVRALGAVRKAREAWQEQYGPQARLPFKLATGARLVLRDGSPNILAYPQNKAGWGDLCRLLTFGKRRADKGDCWLDLDDLLARAGDLLLIARPDPFADGARAVLARLAEAAPGAVWLGVAMTYRGDDRRRLAALKQLGALARLPLIAVNDVLYHEPAQRPLQDVMTCIREGVTLAAAGRLLQANAERHLKPADEMARLFRDAPEAVVETGDFLARVDFSLEDLGYDYPEEPVPPGRTPQSWLEELTWRRATWRYPGGIPEKVEKLIREELALIASLDYARYFLTIHDIVRFAEDRGILCQGRGSAANSAVCYALGITAVDPAEHDLLFARFISAERREPPDIDVDFEHERREEVIQHIYQRYGRDRAGIAATVISYRPRSAIREVGKVLGLTEDITARLADTVWGSWEGSREPKKKGRNGIRVNEAGLDPGNPLIARAVELATRLLGFPRHLSQHVGGFVLTRGRLDEIVPIGNAAMDDRTFIEWDKDDIDEIGLMKVDVLALGMLTCIRKGFDLLRAHCGEDLQLADVEGGDKKVYAMLQKGDSIGVFQVESRAQINMLPRLKPKNFYDLVIQVAIVRPGPIQGDMVHPYLRRRNEEEDVVFPSPAPPHDPDELCQVLGRTLGVPLFQEQAMKIAMVAAEFTPEEANGLRRAMATFRHMGTIHTFEEKMVEGMVRRGYERTFAERCFAQIRGFGEYGFPESHAASFAKLVYISAWIKYHHPAVFACALLNAQPMGFYAPAQIVRDAREHGVEVRSVDVNASFWDNTLEDISEERCGHPPTPRLERPPQKSLALRLGLRQLDGFREEWAERLGTARGAGFASIEELWHRTRLPRAAFEKLADADCFGSLELSRREALWAVRRLPDDEPLPLFAAAQARELADEPSSDLPAMPLPEEVITDYQTLRLSLKDHPMRFFRAACRRAGIKSCAELDQVPDGARAKVAGLVLIRQRPGKGNAVFMTLEDETGVANALFWVRRFERYRREVMGAKVALIEGRVQKSAEGVVHLIAEHIEDRSHALVRLIEDRSPRGPNDPARPGPHQAMAHHPRNVRIVPKSRDFH